MTDFNYKYGAFQFSVEPFELKNSLALFQRMATKLLEDLHLVRVYIDDVVVYSN